MKRVVVIADLHCGHKAGLTPPDWEIKRPSDTRAAAYKRWRVRRKCWRWYIKKIEALQPVDLLIVNGDAIDGKGPRSGGTELLTSDRNDQVDMAVACIDEWNARNIVMSYGTPYHTGMSEDWEDAIAKQVDALKIGGHDWVDVNGLVFDYRHFINASIIPHGRHTAIAREDLWNAIWADRNEFPRAQIFIRSHVHYYKFNGDADYFAVITPALQAYGSKFGARRCSGSIDYGFVHFDVEDAGDWEWHAHILRFKSGRQAVIKI